MEEQDEVEVEGITQEEEDSDTAFCPLRIGGQNLCLAKCALFEPDDEDGGECGFMEILYSLRSIVKATEGMRVYLKNI